MKIKTYIGLDVHKIFSNAAVVADVDAPADADPDTQPEPDVSTAEDLAPAFDGFQTAEEPPLHMQMDPEFHIRV